MADYLEEDKRWELDRLAAFFSYVTKMCMDEDQQAFVRVSDRSGARFQLPLAEGALYALREMLETSKTSPTVGQELARVTEEFQRKKDDAAELSGRLRCTEQGARALQARYDALSADFVALQSKRAAAVERASAAEALVRQTGPAR